MSSPIEKEWAKSCNTTSRIGRGICSLEWDHAGDHSAGETCAWERSDDDVQETYQEAVGVLQDLMKDLLL